MSDPEAADPLARSEVPQPPEVPRPRQVSEQPQPLEVPQPPPQPPLPPEVPPQVPQPPLPPLPPEVRQPPEVAPEVPLPPEVRQRSELEIRWRQARNPPPPVVRAVVANIAVAAIGGLVLLVVDWLVGAGVLPAGWASVAPLIYVALVIVSGSLLTYLWVELPTGRPGERRRSGWSAVLGFFASIPIVYLALVLIFQVVRPLLP